MTEYTLTYNAEKFQYIIWDEKGVLHRVRDLRRDGLAEQKVIELLRLEYEKTKQPLEITHLPSASADLEDIKSY